MDVQAQHDHAAWLTIDLDALVRNYRRIAELAAPARTGAVVKADAYGLGAREVTEALAEAGCGDFFIAQWCEARTVVAAAGPGACVYVLNGLPSGAEPACADLGAVPVLNSPDQIARWDDLGRHLGRRLRCAIQIDSGMGRLGLCARELDACHAAGHAHLDPILVMSHLACADAVDAPANEAQRRTFEALAAPFGDMPRSLANSGGTFLGRVFRQDLVRAGIALYGVHPQRTGDPDIEPVVSLSAAILQLRSVPAGAGIGYGLTAVADHDRRIAAIPIGYADGWPRNLGNRGFAFVAGQKVPIVGRISMDSMLLDVTTIDQDEIGPGTRVELLGPAQSLADVAADAGTIAYEILTRLGRRYARHYLLSPPLQAKAMMIP